SEVTRLSAGSSSTASADCWSTRPIEAPPMNELQPLESPLLEAIRTRTPARLLVGRAGAGYRTATQLQLRQDHAAARDAVCAEMELARDLGEEVVARHALFEVRTRAADKQQYLMRPDLGRQLDEASRQAGRPPR